MTTVLVLGGTAEAVEIARRAAALPDITIVYSLAGRTRAPRLPGCAVRRGGFGGADGLMRYISDNDVAAVIDATHPYATQMAGNARTAADRAGVPLLKFLRPAWEKPAGATWLEATTVDEAAGIVDGRFARVFLSIGAKDLGAFAKLSGCWFLVRTVDAPAALPDLPAHQLVTGRGPFEITDETTLLREHRIDALVTRNSGGAATEAKLHAAAALGIPVIMIARPPTPGMCYDSIERLVTDVRRHLAGRGRHSPPV